MWIYDSSIQNVKLHSKIGAFECFSKQFCVNIFQRQSQVMVKSQVPNRLYKVQRVSKFSKIDFVAQVDNCARLGPKIKSHFRSRFKKNAIESREMLTNIHNTG